MFFFQLGGSATEEHDTLEAQRLTLAEAGKIGSVSQKYRISESQKRSYNSTAPRQGYRMW